MRILVLLLVLLSTSFLARGQNTPACFPERLIAEMRAKTIEQSNLYQSYAAEYASVTQQRMAALLAAQDCLRNKSPIDDLSDALSMEETRCNRLIREHNNLNAKAKNLMDVISALNSVVQANLLNLKLAEDQRCPPKK